MDDGYLLITERNHMRLAGKKLLLLITDGVDETEFDQIKQGFLSENAVVYVTTPQEYLTVESVTGTRRGKDIIVDLPFEAVASSQFDGLIIPDGLLSTDRLKKDPRVLELVYTFHQRRLPIFASGLAVQLLYESQVLSEQIVVREGTPMRNFLDQAVEVLLDYEIPRPGQALEYRSMQ
jgi:putative intracellular protease/amidase